MNLKSMYPRTEKLVNKSDNNTLVWDATQRCGLRPTSLKVVLHISLGQNGDAGIRRFCETL